MDLMTLNVLKLISKFGYSYAGEVWLKHNYSDAGAFFVKCHLIIMVSPRQGRGKQLGHGFCSDAFQAASTRGSGCQALLYPLCAPRKGRF